jgi:hypothetical protein
LGKKINTSTKSKNYGSRFQVRIVFLFEKMTTIINTILFRYVPRNIVKDIKNLHVVLIETLNQSTVVESDSEDDIESSAQSREEGRKVRAKLLRKMAPEDNLIFLTLKEHEKERYTNLEAKERKEFLNHHSQINGTQGNSTLQKSVIPSL